MHRFWFHIMKCTKFVMLAVALPGLLVACSMIPTMASSAGDNADFPDNACSAENIEGTLLKTHELMREFDQVLFIAQNAPPSQLVSPLMKMQEIRHTAEQQKAPDCMQALKTHRDNYMNATLIYMAHFMSGQESTIQTEMAAAAKFQTDYKSELTRLLEENKLAPVSEVSVSPEIQSLPAEIEQSAPEVSAVNTAETTALLRKQPDYEAEIAGALEPDQQVRVLARSADQLWLQVECADAPDGKAWIDRQSVEISGAEESLPVYTPES